MTMPQVTVIVSAAERFSCTKQTLESIYENTQYPFDLVYVDGGSPVAIRRYLEEQAKVKGFQLIRTEHYLSPSQARNLGMQKANSKYVVLIDNDVFVGPGWLQQLVQCAEETEATIVAPLVCIGEPLGEKIHLAGGEARIELQDEPGKAKPRRRLLVKHYFPNRPLAKVRDQLHRTKCQMVDLHCVLVRTEMLKQLGGLDEELLSTREHVDLCLSVKEKGGTIYCEPASVVTYVPVEERGTLTWSDLPYFMLRWSDAWERSSLDYFLKKWELMEDEYVRMRYKRLGNRRYQVLLGPLLKRSKPLKPVERAILKVERTLNQYITNRYQRRIQVAD